jgi:hypothetical protein
VTLGIGAGCNLAGASVLRRITPFSDAMRIKKLAQARIPLWYFKDQTEEDCTRLIYLNLSAGQSEKDERCSGHEKIGAVAGGVIDQHEANKSGAIGLWPPRRKTVKFNRQDHGCSDASDD